MAEHIIRIRLSRLLATSSEDIITLADDMKLVPNFINSEDGMVECQYKVELTNARDYTKEQIKKICNGNKMISRWVHTTDHEDGKDKLVIIIK